MSSNGPSLTLSLPALPSATIVGTAKAGVALLATVQPEVSLGTSQDPVVSLSFPPTPSLSFITVPQPQFSVSGSNPLMFMNVVGMGGTIAFLSGSNLVISGFGGSLAGVSQGELEATGTQIGNSLGSLSGYVNTISGALQQEIVGGGGTVVKVTGSSPLANVIFTGIGGTLVMLSGGFVLISGGGSGGGSYDPLGTAAATGQILYGDLTGLSGQVTVTYATLANLTQSGVFIEAQIASVSGWAASALGLMTTGQALYSDLTGMSGAFNTVVSSLATASNLTATGAAIEGQLTSSGSTLLSDILGLSGISATSVGLGATGQALYLDITGLSGQSANTYATISNLTLSGQTLFVDITGLSGAHGITIALTGQNLYNLITALSGQLNTNLATIVNLTSTGQALLADILGLSGIIATASNLALTGQVLYNDTTGLSGQLVSNITNTYATLVNVGATGQTLLADITGMSGITATTTALGSTGQSLYLDITGMSGQLATNVANAYATLTNVTQTGVTIEGQLNALSGFTTGASGFVSSTYATLINVTQSGVTIEGQLSSLSGWAASAVNLALTGAGLYLDISGLSGVMGGISGGLQAQITAANGSTVKVTGSGPISTVNLTGMGGVIVFLSGSTLFISGITGAGGGGGSYDPLGTAANTGQNLYLMLTGMSGQATTNYALATSLTSTGQALLADIVGLSGISATITNLGSTGQALFADLTGMSGQLVANVSNTYATLTNLQGTGQALYGDVTGLSGLVTATYSTLTNLTSTGQALLSDILGLSGIAATTANLLSTGQSLYVNLTGLSGQAVATYATLPSLTSTGQALISDILGLSGIAATVTNLGSTGQALFLDLTGMSGQIATNVSNTYATLVNVTLTGQALYLDITGLSGQLTTNASNLYATLVNVGLTGQTLYSYIGGLSGVLASVSGGLQSQIAGGNGTQVKVTGSSTLSSATISGIGTTVVTLSGSFILISGVAGGGGSYDPLGTAASTGQTLYSLIAGMSGQNAINYAPALASYVYQTGNQSITGSLNVSGNLNTSGALYIGRSLVIGGTPTFTPISIPGSLVFSLVGNVNSGLQFIMQDVNTGNQSSPDFFMINDTGNFVNVGINSVQYTGMGAANIGNGGYIFVQTGDFAVGTFGPNILHLFVSNSDVATVSPTGVFIQTGFSLYVGLTGYLVSQITTPIQVTEDAGNTFLQFSIQNIDSGNQASTDHILANNSGTNTGYYADIGINSTNYTGLGPVNIPSGAYFFNATGDVSVGPLGNNLLHLFANNIDVVVVSNSGVGINGNVIVSGGLVVSGMNLMTGFDAYGIAASSGQALYNDITGLSGVMRALTGVAQLNGLQGAVNITGTGSVSAILVGQTIYVSGSAATAGGVTTETNLGNGIGIFSGLSGNNNYANLYSLSGATGIGMSISGGQIVVSVAFQSGQTLNMGNNLGILTTGLAGRVLPVFYDTGWGRTFIQPAFWNKQCTVILPAATTSQTIIGDTATNGGTLSTVSTEVLGDYTNYASAAGAYSNAGTSNTTTDIFRGSVTGRNGFFFVSKFSFATPGSGGVPAACYGNPSGSRFFIGISDQSVSAATLVNDPAGNRVGLSYIWATGGTQNTKYQSNWLLSSKNNVTEFTGDSTMNFQTGYYRFSMYCQPYPNNGVIYWQLDDLIRLSGCAGAITGNLPVNSTAMRMMASFNNCSGGAKSIGTNVLYSEIPMSIFD